MISGVRNCATGSQDTKQHEAADHQERQDVEQVNTRARVSDQNAWRIPRDSQQRSAGIGSESQVILRRTNRHEVDAEQDENRCGAENAAAGRDDQQENAAKGKEEWKYDEKEY